VRRALIHAAVVLAMLAGGAARAVQIKIDTGGDPNSRLEIRTLTLPDGSQAELYVLVGHQVHVTIGNTELVADHIEFDLTNRVVRVIGYGRYTSGGQTVAGNDLVIDLGKETFQAKDVIISTSSLDVNGDTASRVPGQISILAGHFSPCSRCDQSVEDYGFSANRIELYPGDRLVAYGVTVLVRGRPLFNLPLLVVPLAPPNREPRLSLTAGTATVRAEVMASWPYVLGANAFGDMNVHYYADVAPGSGSTLENHLLGGQVLTSYVGGGFDHHFYTDRGKGEFRVEYTPFALVRYPDGTVAAGPKGQSTLQFDLHYATDSSLGPPQTSFYLQRDDTVRNRIWQFGYSTTQQGSGLEGTFSSQGFMDLQPGDDVTTPSYASRTVPLFTVARLQVKPSDLQAYRFGPFQVQSALFDLGVFQDTSNPLDRSAAANAIATAARLLDNYALVMPATSPWTGMAVSGKSVFTGQYYGSGERLVDWNTGLTAAQSVSGVGSLSLSISRATAQGQTPFVFDRIPLYTHTEADGKLVLDPLPWASLQVLGGYVFADSRNAEVLGLQPVQSRLTLFNNMPWIQATVSNSYDVKNADPGTIDATLDLTTTGLLRAQLQLEHVQDLKVTPDRLTGLPTDESHSQAAVSLAYPGLVALSASTGYTYQPLPPPPGQPPQHWDPLDLSLTIGTVQQGDQLPGIQLTYQRDLNVGAVTALSLQGTAPLGPLQFSASETLAFPLGSIASSALRLAWPGIAAVEADGLAWLSAGWLGFPGDPTAVQPIAFRLEDAPPGNVAPSWQVRYASVYDPALNGGSGGYRNTDLTARALLTDRQVGPANFSVDLFSDLPIRDDAQPFTYLRRASLIFGLDLYQTVGLQGSIGYSGNYSAAAGQMTSEVLTIGNLSLMVRPLKDVYVGAVLNNTFDLTGTTPGAVAAGLLPTFVVAWDRCCWALYGSWNSATNQIRIALSTPGSQTSPLQVLNAALMPGEKP